MRVAEDDRIDTRHLGCDLIHHVFLLLVTLADRAGLQVTLQACVRGNQNEIRLMLSRVRESFSDSLFSIYETKVLEILRLLPTRNRRSRNADNHYPHAIHS